MDKKFLFHIDPNFSRVLVLTSSTLKVVFSAVFKSKKKVSVVSKLVQ